MCEEKYTVSFPCQVSLDLDVSPIFDGSGEIPFSMDLTSYEGIEPSDWDMADMNIVDFQEFENQSLMADPFQSSDAPTVDYSELVNDDVSEIGHEVVTRKPPTSISTMPTYHLRSFAQRPSIKGRRQTTATLMLNILISYPMMMRSPDSLPPFIHPYSLSYDKNLGDRPSGSLSTCMSLMQMISTNMPGSRKLLWKNVRSECERMQEEWRSFDKWELLSTMQALLVYILLRLQDGEAMENNFDVLLLAIAWVVAKGLNQVIGNIPCDRPCGVDSDGSREAWIFEESRRRLAVTFGTMCMLFSMEPSSDCIQYDGFLLTPLPATKQLLEARDERAWSIEKSRDAGSSIMVGIMTDGQMAKLDESHAQAYLRSGLVAMAPITSKESNANWQEWCAGMDALGGLIVLAASLPGLCP